jgi:uncharacterized protein (TIGR02453 family)
MPDGFEGFGPPVFAWFGGLEQDNTKAYFTATRELYETAVRGGLEALLEELGAELEGTARVFRQQRDLRFTPDKTPYKTRTYGIVQGVPWASAGLYAELSAHGLYAGSGLHQLASDQLERYRAAVDDDTKGDALAAAVAGAQDAGLQVEGRSLRTTPRGYPRDHPRIELLRRRALIAGLRLAPTDAGIGRDAALTHVADTWLAARPLTTWLAENVGPSTLPVRGRAAR